MNAPPSEYIKRIEEGPKFKADGKGNCANLLFEANNHLWLEVFVEG